MLTAQEAADQVGLVRREVRSGSRDGQPTKLVLATRSYSAERTDVWDALTNPDRLPRWFAPVAGELKEGGSYQVENNAGGTIEHCNAPEQFNLTWEFAGGVSWLQVTLTEQADQTQLELLHEAPIDPHWETYGPGAVGVGWDLSLLGLALHLESGEAMNPAEVEAWSVAEAGKTFLGEASDGWCVAAIADGADPEAARAAADQVTAFFTTAPESPDGE